jgi:phage terminase large subunit-like protein
VEAVRPVDHFAAFCETPTQSEDPLGGQPLKLEPWQKRFWREALEDWRSVVLIVWKNGKTQMLAAFALYELVYGTGRPELLLAADRQAGRLFDAAARFVRRHLGLSARLRVRDHEGTIVREDGVEDRGRKERVSGVGYALFLRASVCGGSRGSGRAS